MGRSKSVFMDLVPLLTKRYFHDNPGILSNLASEVVLNYGRKRRVLKKYNFNPAHHSERMNLHRAHESTGCGCKLCIARHEYVKEKMVLHRRKRTFNSDWNDLSYLGHDESLKKYTEEREKSEREEFYAFEKTSCERIKELKHKKDRIILELREVGILSA